MFTPSVIFQRTHSGRDEIHQKSHGLTQSERLVLIMVDGVSSYQALRDKLPALTPERFDRAFQNLQRKDLILEVFLPLEGQCAEELDRSVVDRFLQQDPLDPVTIILRDPEDELGELAAANAPIRTGSPGLVETFAPESAANLAERGAADQGVPELQVGAPGTAMDEFHNQLADALAEEVRSRRQARPTPPAPAPFPQPTAVTEFYAVPECERFAISRLHWGYWMIALGCAFIGGYLLARIAV